MNDKTLTSRWTFRWFHGEGHPAIQRLVSLPVSGAFENVSLTQKTGVLIAITILPDFWKLDGGTWWRKDVKAAIIRTVAVKPPKRLASEMNVLLWSRLSEAVELGKDVRLITPEDAREEAAVLWTWIAHVVTQPVRIQKAGGLVEGFDQWKAKTPATLPDSPFLKRSSKPRSSRSTEPT